MNSKSIREAVADLLQWLGDNNYSQNTIAFYRSRCNAVLAHAEQEKAEFNLESFMAWASKHTEGRSNSIQCCMRKALAMLDCIIRGMPIPRGNFIATPPLKAQSLEFVEAVGTFTQSLLRRDLEKNTVKFSVYCANHFFSYMERNSVGSVAEITRSHVFSYLLFDAQNLANSTKRAMVYRLKQLLIHLDAEGLSDEGLSSCVPTDYAIRKKLITVLPEDARKTMLEWKGGFSSERQARDYAICMLALRLMLRKSDIRKLKLGDIDWVGKKIAIVQTKSKLPLVLPLPDDVGNALAEYILDFRPKSEYDEVFLRAAFPVAPMVSLDECLRTVLICCGYTTELDGYRYGLHLLRRTGASNLLKAGVPIDMISTMLGHQNVSTVDPYLSTDEMRMLLCCGSFEIPGFCEVPE